VLRGVGLRWLAMRVRGVHTPAGACDAHACDARQAVGCAIVRPAAVERQEPPCVCTALHSPNTLRRKPCLTCGARKQQQRQQQHGVAARHAAVASPSELHARARPMQAPRSPGLHCCPRTSRSANSNDGSCLSNSSPASTSSWYMAIFGDQPGVRRRPVLRAC
jgi:hypothetical protein